MPWNKNGDTGATYPALMSVASVPGADDRSVNEVAGFYWRLTMLSSAHLTDYVVDAGTVAMIGGANTAKLIKLCLRVGLLRKEKRDGLIVYVLLNDPEFVHIRTKAEIEWTRQQKADTTDLRISVPVRLRDGDQCRYCGVVCTWAGKMSARRGTLDHLDPGQPGTVATMVVACVQCNSGMRDQAGEERADLNPSPATPFYSATTAKWLTKNGHPTVPTDGTTLDAEHAEDERPGSQPDTAPKRPRSQRGNARTPRQPVQRPGSRPGHAHSADSDPATPGHRAAGRKDTGKYSGPAPPTNAPPNAHSLANGEPEGMHSTGSGRDRIGSGDVVTSPGSAAPRRRKRSPRGRTTAQRNGDR